MYLSLMKVLGIAITSIFGGIVLLFLLYCFGAAPFNNLALRHFSSQIENMPHPEGTDRISMHENIGIYTGNGNHCDFLVLKIRSYEPSSKDMIKDFYNAIDTNLYFTESHDHNNPPYPPSKPYAFFLEDMKYGYTKEERAWIEAAQAVSERAIYAVKHTQYYSQGFGDICCA